MKFSQKKLFFEHVEELHRRLQEEDESFIEILSSPVVHVNKSKSESHSGNKENVEQNHQTTRIISRQANKKRRRRKNVSKPEKNGNENANEIKNIFSGFTILFVEGRRLSHLRARILKQKVIERGGKITDSLTDETTHIITGHDYIQLLKHLDVTILRDDIKIRTPDWITECLIHGCTKVDDKFTIEKEIKFEEETPSPQLKKNAEPSPVLDDIMEDKQFNEKKEKKEKRHFFACQKNLADEPENINKRNILLEKKLKFLDITDELERLEKIYRKIGEQWRALAYRKAISAIKRCNFPITCEEDARKIKGIGSKTAQKIGEFLTFGHMSKLDHLENDEKVKTQQLFGQVFGIGPKTAAELYSQGFRTLDDLRTKAKLTKAQQIGLKYFEDFKQRIPRDEVERIEKLIKETCEKIKPGLIINTCGSYRRGLKDSGDIDILITDPNVEKPDGLLARIVKELKRIHFLTDDLSSSRRLKDGESDTYMGVCKINGSQYHRRIDLKVYAHKHYCFALLYFTGSDYFNRSMRYYAHQKGLSLSDKSLRHVIRVSKQKVHEGKEIICRTEKEIFDALGLEYKEPHERCL